MNTMRREHTQDNFDSTVTRNTDIGAHTRASQQSGGADGNRHVQKAHDISAHTSREPVKPPRKSGKGGKKEAPPITERTATESEVAADNTGVDTATESEHAKLKIEMAQLRHTIDALTDKNIRIHADMDNLRKRLVREKDEAIRYANRAILLDTVEVLDNFERAMSAVEKNKENEALFSGVQLIEQEWASVLKNKHGLTPIQTVGEAFDPNIHEGVAIEDSGDCTTQIVGEAYQKGYFLYDRVLRSARVKVLNPIKHENKNISEKRP